MGNSVKTFATLMMAGCTVSGCALNVFDRWDGDVVRSQMVQGDRDDVWRELTAGLPAAGMLVAGVSDQAHTIEFSWVTAPGDGRQYLDCGSDLVGSASLRPRIALVAAGEETRIEVSSITRATAASGCTSTGNFEGWLLTQIGVPVSALATAVTAPRRARK